MAEDVVERRELSDEPKRSDESSVKILQYKYVER
jgi:hypothetical protein